MNKFVKIRLVQTLILLLTVLQLHAQEASLPITKNKLVVIAHRGNHVDVPENTIASIEEAIKSGADYVEVDLRTTKDGYLVIHHDATVDRMTNGTGKVADLTWSELKKLKVVDKTKAGQKSERIPLFKDVLKASKGKINIYLDFKDADVAETYRQIKDASMQKQVVVYLNSIPQYKDWRKLAPKIPLMTSVIDEVKTAEQLSFFLDQAKIEVLDNVTDTAMLSVARANGVAVWLDVQDKNEGPASWEPAVRKGVQGLQTDNPAALVSYLNQNGLRDGVGAELKSVVFKRKSYRELKNVKYGSAGKDNSFDAFLPVDHLPTTKIIFYIHGGGWSSGDKSEFPKVLIEELVGKRGYGVVSLNYRLVKDKENQFPAQIEDVKKAIAYVTSGASKYKYNGADYALMGGSAGAHLAMLYAYGHDSKKQVKTVVNLWGPTDLSDVSVRQKGSNADNTVIRFLGVEDPGAQIVKDASPSYHLTKDTGVPTILFHGGQDPLVHVSQAENLYKKLQSLNIPAQLEIYPEEEHGMRAAAYPEVFGKIFTWLDTYFPAK
jgi:glycerophosphoryl diester phosphodiesterase